MLLCKESEISQFFSYPLDKISFKVYTYQKITRKEFTYEAFCISSIYAESHVRDVPWL